MSEQRTCCDDDVTILVVEFFLKVMQKKGDLIDLISRVQFIYFASCITKFKQNPAY